MFILSGFYPSTFVYNHFPWRFNFFTVCLVQLPVGWPYNRHQRENFLNSGLQITGKCIFHGFSWNLRVLWEFLEKSWLERYTQLSFMHFCKYLNQTKKNRWIGPFKDVLKTKKKKKTWKDWVSELNSRLSFYYSLPAAEKCLEKCLLIYFIAVVQTSEILNVAIKK